MNTLRQSRNSRATVVRLWKTDAVTVDCVDRVVISLCCRLTVSDTRGHSSSERSERFVRFEPNVRSERVRYFSERETNVQALKRLINLIAVK